MLATLLLCSLALQDPPAPNFATGAHFEVTCHALPEGFAQIALGEAENAYVALLAALEIEDEPRDAFEVHLYVSKESFDSAVRDLADDELQFLELAERRAHVCLQPLVTPEVLGDLGLPWRTRRAVAVSAARLALSARLREKPDVPPWLVEGLALWAGEQAALETRTGYVPERDPYYGWGQEYVRDNVRDDRVDLQDVVVGKAPDWYDSRLAHLHHHVVRFLLHAEQREAGRKVFDAALEEEGSKDFEKRIGKALRRPEWKALDKAFAKYCEGLAPQWSLFDGMLDLQDERWLHASGEGNTNYAWHTGEVGERGVAVSGKVTVLSSSLGVLLADTDKGFLLVTFAAGAQQVTVFEFDNGKRAYEELATDHAPFELFKEFTFAVEARAKRLKAIIDGTEVLDFPLGRRKTVGRWGLYGAGGAAGIWNGVVCEDGSGR